MKGRNILEIIRNRDLQRMVQITLVDGTDTEGDITLYNRGEQILNTRCTPLVGAGGDRLGILLVINDVTQLRRLENMRSDFAANVSHEIKAPLTAIQSCKTTARQRNIAVGMDVDKDPKADMDADLLEQALVNLIDNAVKYSPSHSAVAVSAEKTDSGIQISVRDQGVGIAQKHLPRLFERFYRVDKARSRKMSGTGLGLAIVKHIIQSHGGRVTVDSAQGVGSTFTLHLPQ